MKKMSKSAKLVAAVTLAVSMVASPSVFALNGYGNAPLSFLGYEVVDNTHVALFFDAYIVGNTTHDIVGTQFKLTANGSGTNLLDATTPITVTSGIGYAFTDTTGCNVGTKVVLNLASGNTLTDNNLYDVTIDGSVLDDNGVTIGNYQNRKGITFTFQDPPSGTWDCSSAPIITYVVGDGTSNVSYESNMTAIFSRPVNLSMNSTFLDDLNYAFVNTTLSREVPGYESNFALCNNYTSNNTLANTFYFPMQYRYNRVSTGSNSYSLDIPQYTDINGSTTVDPAEYTFSTVASDYPGWEMNGQYATSANAAPSVSLSGTTLTVGWYDTWVDPNPTGYKVYYNTTSAHAPAANWTLLATTTGHTDGQRESHVYTVPTAGITYYVRIVPYKTYNSVDYLVGFSRYGNN